MPGTTFCPVCGSRVADQSADAAQAVDSYWADAAGQTVDGGHAVDSHWGDGVDRSVDADGVSGMADPTPDGYPQPVQPSFQPEPQLDQTQFRPQVTPSQLEPVPDAAPTPTPPRPAKKRSSTRTAIVFVVAAVIAAGGGFAGYSWWQQAQHQQMLDQTTSAVKKVVDEQYGKKFEGFVPNNYVNPSDYKVKSVKVDNIMESSGLVSGSAKVVTKNRSFRSSMNFTFNGSRNSDGSVSNVSLDLEDKSTEPVRGIDYDEQNGLKDLDPELSGDSCTVRRDIPGGAPWYYDSSYHQEYEYSFDEDDGWGLMSSDKCDDEGDSNPMQDISGTYEDAGGASTPDIYLKISNYNEDEQTISVELGTDFSLSTKHMSGNMVFRKDDIKLEPVDDDSEFMCFRIGEGGGLVTGPEEINGARGATAALWFVLNPTSSGGINVFKGDDCGLSVYTGTTRRGRFGVLDVTTKVNGGMMSHLSEFSESSFSSDPSTPQFVKQ